MGRDSKPEPSNLCKLSTDKECTSIMQIPSRLVKSYGEILPKEATLRIGESGKCWKVGIEKFKDQYFFTDGWKKFAEDVDLESREYLLFKSPVFQQDKTNSGDYTKKNEKEDSFTDQEEDSYDGEKLTFSKELKMDHAYRLNIPKYFTTGTGIATKAKIKLLDDKGRTWPINVTNRGGVYSLCSGWNDFLISNDVLVGSTISFEFISSNIMEAQVVKKGTNETELFKFVKRKKGGKFKLVNSDKTSDHAKPSLNSHLNIESENEDELTEPDSRVGKKWVFSKELKKHHAYQLDIPSDFSRGVGITKNIKITLVDGEGRKWPVNVKHRKQGIYAMVGGLLDFFMGNKAGVGDTISFELISGSHILIQAKLHSNGRKRKDLFVTRGRGRPFEMSEML